jgi:hypothetical protein
MVQSSAKVGKTGLDFSLAVLMVVWVGMMNYNGSRQGRERNGTNHPMPS